jgi:flavin reductase (DIM6/NTAB) family NADH-FMN oxidoreductase RutF
MFSANQTPTATQKDTVVNVEATGVFCWNLATWDLREEVNNTAEQVAYGVDEFVHAGLEKVDSTIVRVGKSPVPMVKRSPVRFECEHYTTLRLPGNPPMGAVDVVIGKVVGIHIDEAVLTNGKIDVRKTQPIARCGYYEYAVVRETFEMRVPGESRSMLAGLEGSAKFNRGMNNGEAEAVAERKSETRVEGGDW